MMTDAADIIRIEIAEIENRSIYRVWHGGVVLIERTTTPMRAAAPDDVIEMTRRGSNRVDMRARIGAVALLEGHSGRDEGDADDGGQSDAPEQLEAARRALKRPQRPSESDSCDSIVAMLDGNRRVISDGVQWMLQTRSGIGWKSRSYCRTKEALIRCCGGSTPELAALPHRIGGSAAPIIDVQDAAE
jgi:hypothetical protein